MFERILMKLPIKHQTGRFKKISKISKKIWPFNFSFCLIPTIKNDNFLIDNYLSKEKP